MLLEQIINLLKNKKIHTEHWRAIKWNALFMAGISLTATAISEISPLTLFAMNAGIFVVGFGVQAFQNFHMEQIALSFKHEEVT